jgi:hypothetical protein
MYTDFSITTIHRMYSLGEIGNIYKISINRISLTD